MSIVWTLVISVVTAITTAVITAWAQYGCMTKIEAKRVLQKRQSIGVMLQAELIHLHYALKQHNRTMQGYISKAGNVGGTSESDYRKFETNERFPVFQNSISDIGLFDRDLSYQIAYCYFNAGNFLQHQQRFLHDLTGLLNSSALAARAQDLGAIEKALMTQIERIIPMLAKQSQSIPFLPESG